MFYTTGGQRWEVLRSPKSGFYSWEHERTEHKNRRRKQIRTIKELIMSWARSRELINTKQTRTHLSFLEPKYGFIFMITGSQENFRRTSGTCAEQKKVILDYWTMRIWEAGLKNSRTCCEEPVRTSEETRVFPRSSSRRLWYAADLWSFRFRTSVEHLQTEP